MSTYTQIMYHVVFSTKNRAACLHADNRETLFRYINGVLENKQCHVYQVNGVADRLHILCGLHPTVSLASLVKDIKVASSQFIKEQDSFPGFTHWQDGYGAFTCSHKDKDAIIRYIQGRKNITARCRSWKNSPAC